MNEEQKTVVPHYFFYKELNCGGIDYVKQYYFDMEDRYRIKTE